MRKADVDIYQGLPSVNVKVDAYDWQRFVAAVGSEFGSPGFTPEWCQAHISDGLEQSYWESACENGWELAQGDAEEVFQGYPVKVYGEGCSGGHLVVSGLPDIETWDAVMVARWAKFARWARDTADTVPQVMAELVCINAYDEWRTAQDACEALSAAAELPVLLSV